MQRLATTSGASSLRFWGKIFGTINDYTIVEGMLDNAEETRIDHFVEKRGDGVNKLVYWVTDNILEDWVQLPDSRPEQI